jgi:cytochrome c553
MRKPLFILTAGIAVVLLSLTLSCNIASPEALASKGPDSAQLVKRGEYLVSAIGCDDCHSPKKMGPRGPELDMSLRLSGYPASRPLAAFDSATARNWALFNPDLTACVGPWGVSFSGNITSDATGIGNWTEAQFIRCLREGKWKGLENGRPLLPPMPWQNFAKLSDDDLRGIYAYLKTTPPVNNTVPAPLPPGSKPIRVKQTAQLSPSH